MPLKKFNKLLVANRGEIAIRILRAASELKISTIAVYTYEDRYSLHRYKADESYQIGINSEPLKPYLDIEEIIRVAKTNEADAVHPGYGFLSENVQLAKRCAEEGITFVGPRPDVMERLGDKVASKVVARECGVPLIPDSNIKLEKLSDAMSEGARIGFPVMLKASAGGGGRGMRVVKSEEEMSKAFTDAKSEAKKAFGDDTVFIEKYIDSPKHIEVQLLGDNEGNIVHLYERDCSVQRRFQKVIEVAPSILKRETREKLFDYALRLAKHVQYNNAGTVEFLVDADENIYFIEVNPRIQVEHTITEEITGIDIVRSQILLASGCPLTHAQIFLRSQADVQCNGFAIQCRITTEDPENDFKPDFGTIVAYRNAGGFGIRLDEGSSYSGVKISPFFDSMLVKVSAWSRTLKGATKRMERVLQEFRIRGVKTNIPFLVNVMSNEEFQTGRATVGFIPQNPQLLIPKWGYDKDRGTKMVRYLAELKVNGHPDIKSFDAEKKFRTPVVPQVKYENEFPKGYKNLLEEMGREKFLDFIKKGNRILNVTNSKGEVSLSFGEGRGEVLYTDTTFRDAHQSLFATRLRNIDMLAVAEGFAKNHPEVFSMEVWGGATFDVCMRFLHEDPWERLRLLRKAVPNILLQMLFRGSNAVGYAAYPDNLVAKFIEKSAENGIDIFRIFDSLNWLDGMKMSIKTVREKTNSIAEACICYTGDIMNPERQKFNLKYYVELAKQLEGEGAHILCIKDMAGLLKPYAAQQLIGELKKNISIPIHLHTHDTSSLQAATYLKAIEAGVDVIDVALASMSGLTSQPNFNSIVAMMKGHERENPVNLKSLNAYSNYFEVVREYYYPFESELKAGTAEVYEHEIPGGQYSNLLPQARSLGLEDKFETIKHNYEVVNEMFGDVVKVTPSSKVVNNLTKEDVLAKGDTLSFPDSVKQLFRGDLGQPHGGFPKQLQKIILKDELPYTDKPNAHLGATDFDRELSAFRNKYDEQLTMEDFLSHKMYPKVFDEYYAFQKHFGDVSFLPTPSFYYPMKPNEEILITIEPGKSLLVRFMYMSEPNEDGMRDVFFKINGQTRSVQIRDRTIKVTKVEHYKAKTEKEIGAPLQGKLVSVLVKEGDKVSKNQPLFVIEAMKMESTITAPAAGTVSKVYLTEGVMVEQDDCVIAF
ncbi:MAG: pyruvate carboxylase [Bacteroidetes bacterium]|nr:pyruvate carboxylase [Bacteroidota bacterium]